MGIDSCITKFLIPAHTLAVIDVIKANGFLQLFLPIFFLLYCLLLALFIETVISGILMRRKPSVIALHPGPAHTACNGHYASNIGGVSTEQCCHCGSSSPLSSPPLASPGCCRAGSPDIRVTYLHFTSLDWCDTCVQVRRGRSLWRRWRY